MHTEVCGGGLREGHGGFFTGAWLEASTFEVRRGSLWLPPLEGVQGYDDHEGTASLPYT